MPNELSDEKRDGEKRRDAYLHSWQQHSIADPVGQVVKTAKLVTHGMHIAQAS